MNKKQENKKKFICPNCKADLREVGLRNSQEGYAWFDCKINEKGEIGEWEETGFDARDGGEFYCSECGEELDLEKLGLTI
jgi:transcription initiation factor IIE alpha subunit